MTILRKIRFLLALISVAGVAVAADANRLPVEDQVATAVALPLTTVVHFWAPWCPNCRAELQNGGWARMIEANPNTRFIFVTIWSEDGGRGLLARYGLGAQPNLALLVGPNGSSDQRTATRSFLGETLTWIPTTWVYRSGQLRYALNYGELHFPVLQQLIDDASNRWEH
jgi:thiol-disulfide isomerase/thioredoxin